MPQRWLNWNVAAEFDCSSIIKCFLIKKLAIFVSDGKFTASKWRTLQEIIPLKLHKLFRAKMNNSNRCPMPSVLILVVHFSLYVFLKFMNTLMQLTSVSDFMNWSISGASCMKKSTSFRLSPPPVVGPPVNRCWCVVWYVIWIQIEWFFFNYLLVWLTFYNFCSCPAVLKRRCAPELTVGWSMWHCPTLWTRWSQVHLRLLSLVWLVPYHLFSFI